MGEKAATAGPLAPDDGCLTDVGCRTHYDQAVKLFEGGRFEAALPEFRAAYERRQMAWLLINIGRTLHRLGRPREALDYYERYKVAETKPDAETKERLDKYIAQAKALAETSPTPTATPTPTPTPVVTNSEPEAEKKPPPETQQPPPKEEKPIYKKWWFWTAIGGGVVAIVIIGVAAGVATRPSSPGLPDGIQKVTFSF